MSFETVARTDPGRQRDRNEDAVLRREIDDGELLAVADGMGGHADGELASVTALETFEASVFRLTDDDNATVPDVLTAAVDAANEGVLDGTDPNRKSGTTLVAAYLVGKTATLVNVGDSRAYHVTHDGIEQLTVDQSPVQRLVEEGVITKEEAEEHPQRNLVSQALGTSIEVEPDVYERSITGTLLLCSDGLTEEVCDDRIRDIVAANDCIDEVAESLIERANENGGSDNISVALARRTPDGGR